MIRARDFLLMLAAFVALGLVLAVLVRVVLRPWWRRRAVRRSLGVLLVLDAAVPSLWFLLKRLGHPDIADGLVTVHLLLFVTQAALIGLVTVVALLRAAGRVRLPGDDLPTASSRRRFLFDAAAVALPAAAVAAGVGGVVETVTPVHLRRLRLPVANLPPALTGLRILHLSDVHLWTLVTTDDLARALRQVPQGACDLVCMTGDLADDMAQLPRGLELIADLDAPLGHFACLGNHEHARGLREALRAYADSEVSLLRASGRVLEHRGQPLVIAGIDDLRALPRTPQREFYPDQLRRALGPTDPAAFTLLLSHRPSVLPHAAAAGVDVVLAGHTHGGQLAIAGTSILELNGATRWAWGIYQEAEATMHVTAGMGQWFPFRLGCPPEMVLLELVPLPTVARAR